MLSKLLLSALLLVGAAVPSAGTITSCWQGEGPLTVKMAVEGPGNMMCE